MNGRYALDTNIVIALQHDLTLASRDQHYSAIDGLTVVDIATDTSQ